MSSQGSTDFFTRQDEARKATGRLIFLFGIAVVMLSVGTYLGMMGLMVAVNVDAAQNYIGSSSTFFVDLELAFWALVVTAAVIAGGSYLKTNELSKGGSVVAEEMGGREIDSSSSDPLERRYVNVVEEMALASGVPVPRIYVLDGEAGINAFAAGYTMNDAAVAVTRGGLEQLTRAELQGVMAHEFSHILNGDMRLNIRLIGVIHGILVMYLTGRILMSTIRAGGSRGRGGGVAAVVAAGFALWLFGLGGLLCGRLIKSAVSRQREYLADAAAVQFTRNPEGLAGALKKIGGYDQGSALSSADAEEVSHMCFGRVSRGGGGWLTSWMSTHPPLEKRIAALDPAFEGHYEKLQGGQARSGIGTEGAAGVSALAGGGGAKAKSGAKGEQHYAMEADDVSRSVGQQSSQQLVYCSSLLDEIPPELMKARSEPMGAMALVYTMLLDEDPEERKKQSQMLKRYGQPAVVAEARKLWTAMGALDPELKLPLMDLLVPTLRRLTEQQYEVFTSMVDRLIWADDKISFEEFILEQVLLHRLEVARFNADRKVMQFHSFSGVMGEIEILLSCLAHVGHEGEAQAKHSFGEGAAQLPPAVGEKLSYREPARWTYSNVSACLERLSVASPQIKKAVIDACAHCVMGDGEVVLKEAEMLRAVCESLDVPLPPFIPEATKRD